MSDFAKEVIPVSIEQEMKQSYLDYAMSVIVGRALPDVRDGLKPVHRRVLYAMHQLGNDWNKPYKKSARVVGDTVGKYHPHGEGAVYEALVRMAQPFAFRDPLVDGQGNFGSIDGDRPAAMRYTEVRMAKITHEMLADLDKETVDFNLNYDESEKEPTVLPTKLPNLLVNGSVGIAVGMATNIPPHNLGEVIEACLAYINAPDIDIYELMDILPGPDFPTAAIISGSSGIKEAYLTGRGKIYIRARSHIEGEEGKGKQKIVFTEFPYQVNKARVLEKIAHLHKDRTIEGISDIRDESDKDGIRAVIDLRRGANAEVVLNNLYAHTQLESVFGINLVSLVDNQPRTLNIKEMIEYFVRHRREVITRRTVYELAKARDRAHILEGLAVAIANIDEVITLIKASKNPQQAKEALLARVWEPGIVRSMLAKIDLDLTKPAHLQQGVGLTEQGYRFSEPQVKAILDLRLHRLTGLEQEKLVSEFEELIARIIDLIEILTSPDRLTQIIVTELTTLKEAFSSPRRTEIREDRPGMEAEHLIKPQDVVVTMSHTGYIKWTSVDTYVAQRRGGRGKMAATTKDTDFIDTLFVANTHDTLLCFSSIGKVYWLKVYNVPNASRTSRGQPIVNLLPLQENERINEVLVMDSFEKEGFITLVTAMGTIKKTALKNYAKPRVSGIIAIDLNQDDYLVDAAFTDGKQEIMLSSSNGKTIRFDEEFVRPMGRTARGVRGILLDKGHKVISMMVVDEGLVLTATQNGYGKCTPVTDYVSKGRGGKGVISIQTTKRNGDTVGTILVQPSDEVMLITDGGKLVRIKVDDISVIGRNTQGVRLISMAQDETLVGIERIAEPDDEESD